MQRTTSDPPSSSTTPSPTTTLITTTKTAKAQNDSNLDYFSLESVQSDGKNNFYSIFWILILVTSVALIVVLASIVLAVKKSDCCCRNRRDRIAAFKKAGGAGEDPESGKSGESGPKKLDKSQSEFIKSVTGVDSGSILNSPAFVLYSNSVRPGHRKPEAATRHKIYKSGSQHSYQGPSIQNLRHCHCSIDLK